VSRAWQNFVTDGRQEGEFPVKRPDGSIAMAKFAAALQLAPDRHVSVLHDVTESKRVEAQLRHNEELFLRLFSASPAPTLVSKLSNGVFIEVNEAFTQATGYWRADILGRSARTVGLWKDQKVLDGLLARLRAGEEAVSARALISMKNRSSKEFSVALRKVEIHGELHVIAVYTDLEPMRAPELDAGALDTGQQDAAAADP
jgi:PAS domain S-box-containing protein